VPGDIVAEVFTANTDQSTPVRNLFNRDVVARYVRLYPMSTTAHAGYGLRLELLGCKPDAPVYIPPESSGNTPTPFPPGYTGPTPTAKPPDYTGETPNQCE
jgi:hypothetical protein